MMRVEVIKMTLQRRQNSEQNFVHQIERPLTIYGSIDFPLPLPNFFEIV